MPNDPAGSFPLPPTESQPPTETPREEVKLTDEVAPDLSAPQFEVPQNPAYLDGPEYSRRARGTESVPEPTPARAAPVTPEPIYQPPTQVPAAIPVSVGRPFPIVTILLLLISIGAIAATYFFYQQSQVLNLQLSEITKTLEQQKIKENQATVTPTPLAKPDLASPDASTISATPSETNIGKGGQLIPTPTTTLGNNLGEAFANIDSVIAIAQVKYPDSQLLMVTATNIEAPTAPTFKYWFRQTLTDKRYLYILSEPGKTLSVIDQSVYVTPDNVIPSLNQKAVSDGLGIDLPEAIKIANAACLSNFPCADSTTKAQYIDDLKLKALLWQVIFTSPSGTRYVVQIDAITKKILFQSR